MDDIFYYVLFWHGDFTEVIETEPFNAPVEVIERVDLSITYPREYVYFEFYNA